MPRKRPTAVELAGLLLEAADQQHLAIGVKILVPAEGRHVRGIGQEAVVIGVQMASKDGDQVITGYRDHGHMLACGMLHAAGQHVAVVAVAGDDLVAVLRGHLDPDHHGLYIGQEAVVIGVQMASKDGDQVITGYRDHGHMLDLRPDDAVAAIEVLLAGEHVHRAALAAGIASLAAGPW
jgi:TPP-dependent pyruvate/acetoin dehydrogenase alpha subunit